MALIVLWDIDHTLVDNAGVSKEIYAAAFEAATGIRPAEPAVTQGRTDRLIMRDMFRRNGVEEPEWPEVEAALTRAGQDRLDVLRKRGTALPGVHEVLKETSVRADWVSSVLTGNIASNARVKLSAFDLGALLDLPVGAYGADAEQRPHLVDIARRRVQRDRGLPLDTPKNHERRSVPLSAFLIDELRPHLEGRDPGELLFTSPQRGALRASNFVRRVFDPAVTTAGLGHLRVTPHKLRHTAASLAIASGADVNVVQTMLGHKSATMTLDVYGHLFPDRLDEVSRRCTSAALASWPRRRRKPRRRQGRPRKRRPSWPSWRKLWPNRVYSGHQRPFQPRGLKGR